MFLLLPFLVSSTLWEYSALGLNEKIRGSFKKPLFFLCYSRYCPHCHGLPEGLRNYANSTGNRDDIYISMVDCAVTSCARFKIIGTPTMFLIIGDKVRYWPTTYERGGEGWDRWINQTISPVLREISASKNFFDELNKTSWEGSAFLYKTNSADDPFIEELRILSKQFRIYGVDFVFSVDKNSKRNLRAYTSKYCYFEYKGSYKAPDSKRLKAFVDKHKFGVHHRYDSEELNEAEAGQKIGAVVVTKKDISESQLNSLSEISKGHCDAVYGWYNIDEGEEMLRNVKGTFSDVPFLYGFGKSGGKRFMYKGKISKAWESGFLTFVKNKGSGNALKSFIKKITVEDLMYISIVVMVLMIALLIYTINDYNKFKKAIEKKRLEEV